MDTFQFFNTLKFHCEVLKSDIAGPMCNQPCKCFCFASSFSSKSWMHWKAQTILNNHTEILTKYLTLLVMLWRELIVQNIIGTTELKSLSINLPCLPPYISIILVLLFSPQFNHTNSFLLLQEMFQIYVSHQLRK